MPEAVFRALTNVSWICVSCGLPNFSTGLFDSTIPENTNSFKSISDSSINVDEENFDPTSTSSPIRYARRGSYGKRDTHHPLRILSLNCQSIKAPGKKALLQNMIESTNADIVIGTESWLKN